ncbi:MAG TPA: 3-methyl-2-oxobutanoate hydroxymethyltransferase [Acidimicrobiia bacterium]|nr:3-methyl-2-oxobutanoate hydroxymethyltransferase [Acidimicrobiia bacterium]
MGGKVTVPDVRARKGGQKLTMITAYDFATARIASEAGADMVLVGDSLANVVLGFDSTLDVDLDVMIHHTAAVARAEPDSLLVGDMPWMSYHVSVEDGVRNAGRLVREGGAEAVKLEGGRKRLPVIEAILKAEIPVMGHLGLTPQSVNSMGGYRVQGKAVDEAREMLTDAIAIAEAGVFAMVLEGVPDVLAQIITKEVSVPTIGIGAGAGTDGQVLVFHDVLGMHDGQVPKFVRRYADLRGQAVEALQRFFLDVQSGDFPSDEETYHMGEEAQKALLEGPSSDLSWPLSW